MSLQAESQSALQVLERLQLRVSEDSTEAHDEDLTSLIYLLESPLFNQLLTIQDSLGQLKEYDEQRTVGADDFDIDAHTGALSIHQQEELTSAQVQEAYALKDKSCAGDRASLSTSLVSSGPEEGLGQAVLNAAAGRTIETIDLYKAENSSLGFSVVGLRSEHRGELGIFVQEVQPSGIAHQDGRLRENDQILAINSNVLDANISHQQAIRILQQTRGSVQLIVARDQPTPSTPVEEPAPSAPAQDVPPIANLSPEHSTLDRTPSALSESSSDMVLSSEWSQLEVIDLLNDGTGLGFGIIGGKSTGVVVKTILPGGVSDRDARLRSGDHIMQIGDVNVRGMGSEQVAAVLRQSGAHVRLIVARCVQDPAADHEQIPHAPVVPTHLLDEHLHDLNHALIAMDNQDLLDQMTTEQYIAQYQQMTGELPPGYEDQTTVEMHMEQEVQYFDVELPKVSQGLGITIAGYSGEEGSDDLCGIFVRSIAEGSATAADGRVEVNDQIIEVDGQSLEGFTNHQAIEVLRQTGQVVRLKLARWRHGRNYEQLLQYTSQAQQTAPPESVSREDLAVLQSAAPDPVNLEDITLKSEDYSRELSLEVEDTIKCEWQPIVGDSFIVVVAQLSKFSETGGLGISLEGTVDVEDGVEVRPHHYIRSVLSDGPVGTNARLTSGDELLEVNGRRLLGLNHMEVVTILKELPQHVRIVCARKCAQSSNTYANDSIQSNDPIFQQLGTPPTGYASASEGEETITDRLFKAKSEQVLPMTFQDNEVTLKGKSRSEEPLNNLAMWSSEPEVIHLLKGDKGLGFSILDYQDPINPAETVIVIRSLVPGGVAQVDGRLVPGDRLVFVNDANLENATLEEAVQALKGAQPGMVRVGVAKPMPLPEIGETSTDPEPFPMLEDTQIPLEFQSTAEIATSLPPPTLPPPIPSDSPPSSPPPPPPAKPPSQASGLSGLMLSELSLPTLDMDNTQQSEPDIIAVTAQKPQIPPKRPNLSEEVRLNSLEKKAKTWDRPGDLSLSAARTEGHPSSEKLISPLFGGVASPKSPVSSQISRPQTFGAPKQSPLQSPPPVVTSPKPVVPPRTVTSQSPVTSLGRPKPVIPPKPSNVQELSSPKFSKDDTSDVYTPSLSSPPHHVQPEPTQLQMETVPLVASTAPHYSTTPVTSSDLNRSLDTTQPSPRQHSASLGRIPPLPQALEQTIKIKKGSLDIGMTVDGADPGNGCLVKTISPSGAVGQDGRIQVGDYIVSVNHENFRSITSSQARAILRRASLVGTDISITYIPQSDAAVHIDSALVQLRQDGVSPGASKLSPNSSLQQPGNNTNGGYLPSRSTNSTSPTDSDALCMSQSSDTDILRISPIPDQALSGANSSNSTYQGARPISPNPANSWGQPRTVEIHRKENESLGISIVGGRVDLFYVSQETQRSISGIFIKHVLENSPAGRNGTLQTGDRILEVDGVDLREATHDKAVDVIKHSHSPVTFLVQSLVAEDWDDDSTTEADCDRPLQTSIPLPIQGEDEFGNSWGSKLF